MTDHTFFEFTAHNDQTLYGWGTEADATRYVDWLNRNRTVNVYSHAAIPEAGWGEYEGRSDVMSMDEPHWDDFMDAEAS